MSFSWNKWRQYIIEEASVNEETDKEIIDAAVNILGKTGQETHYLHRKFREEGSDDIDGYDVSNARAIIRKGGKIMEDDQAVYNRGPVDFGNDDKSRFQYVTYRLSGYENHPQYKELQGYVRTMADEMDVEEGSPAFTQAFIKAMQIMGKEDMLREGGESLINPEAEEISPEDLDAAADYFDSLKEDKFDKPGWDLRAIMDSFKEDFEEATRDTDDIPYAQERVVDAYKDVFAKSHPQLAKEIDDYLENRDRTERRSMFQNVADDPEVVGRDMMAEGGVVATFRVGDRAKLIVDPKLGVDQPGEELKVIRVEPQIGGRFQNVQVQNFKGEKAEYDNKQLALVGLGPISRREEDELGGYQLGELEGEVQTEVDAFDEAMNDMAIEKATTATKLDALQNDLEATLSQEEIDALSDAIVLLRKKENLDEALDSKALINIIQALGNVEEEFGTKLGDKEAKTLSDAADIIKNLARK